MTASASSPAGPSIAVVALAGSVSLAVAMGVGRFAFTPLLPMMLRDGTIDIAQGSWLATANYLGYLAGALLCMVLPRSWSGAVMIRFGLIATVLLTLGMALPLPALWPLLRFLAGVVSAVVFVFTAGWCLARLARLGAPAMAGAIFTGPGLGIALSGLAATVMVAVHWSAATGWLVFALLAAVLSVVVWPVFKGADPAAPSAAATAPPPAPPAPVGGGTAEMTVFTLAYGLAGFGYIITATFLPVIAREALPGSVWLDLFWPILGLAVVAGALLTTRVPTRFDTRLVLAVCYAIQGLGVILTLFVSSLAGFIVSSALVGLFITSISFFAMQEARRLRPHHAARFMGLLTALYGIGQIAGPPLTAALLARLPSRAEGFGWSLGIASAALAAGACLYVVMYVVWPRRTARA
ncbi:YbfB/YjiJ family MFS transporter [Skermanella aerolata]|uniref:YbfB/YjiJ family MFS transporter n=1 Tax=Skermanella aerolata TaxID=393310 RepID=UPI0005C8931C|nr:YbfB/YjiJ family MFS transporter [Skermanella aerolata]